MAVGIVGRGVLQVRGVDGAAIEVVKERGIDDAGIGGERHVLREAVDKDSGNERAFGVLGDLFFDQGGEYDRSREVGGGKVELGGGLAEALDHGGKDLGGRGVAGEAVGVREEVALERGRAGGEVGDEAGLGVGGGKQAAAGGETGGFDGLGDVEKVVALGDGEGDSVDVAANDAGVDLGCGRGAVEAVLAGE